MEKKRSVGIVVCSILVISLCLGYFLLFYIYTQKRSLMPYSPLVKLQEIVYLMMGIVYIISALFLLVLKRIARLLIILISSIWIISFLVTMKRINLPLIRTLLAPKYPGADYSIIWLQLLTNISILGLLIGIIIYLTRPKVKEQFKQN